MNEHEHYPVVARAAYLARVPIVVHLRFKPEAAMCHWLFKPPSTPRRLFFTSQTQMDDSAAAVAPAVPRDRWRLIYNGLDLASSAAITRRAIGPRRMGTVCVHHGHRHGELDFVEKAADHSCG